MIMSVSTLIILSGAATPSRVVNLSIAFPVRAEGQAPVSGRVWSFVKGGLRPQPFRAKVAGRSNESEQTREEISMSSTKTLAAAAVIGLAGALLSLPTLASVSVGSDAAVSLQTVQRGTLLAETADKEKAKIPKAKAKAAKKPAAKSKAKGPGPAPAPAKSGGEYQ
jgi:hypothetical protein